jgi:tetratricopeptide (TPR) repeat protein
VITKSRKVAIDHEMLTQTIKISKHCVNLYSQSSNNSKILESDLLQALSESKSALKKLNNLQEYHELYMQFILLIRKEGEHIRSTTERTKFDSIINHPLMTDGKNALTNDANALYHFIKHTYFFIIGELESAYSSYKELAKTETLNHSEQMKRLSNFCEICLRMKKYDEALISLNKINQLPLKSFLEQGKQFYRHYNLLLSLYTQTGHFDKAVALVNTIESGLEHYKSTIHKSKRISIYYYISYAYFGVGDYKNAKKWINLILNDTTADLRRDILCFAYILQLIIHLETKNTLFIEHLVKSSHYYFSTREKLHQFEKIVLAFFKKIHLISEKSKKMELYSKLHAELIMHTDNPYEQEAFLYFDFISWVESKINNDNFMEIVKAKNNFVLSE